MQLGELTNTLRAAGNQEENGIWALFVIAAKITIKIKTLFDSKKSKYQQYLDAQIFSTPSNSVLSKVDNNTKEACLVSICHEKDLWKKSFELPYPFWITENTYFFTWALK